MDVRFSTTISLSMFGMGTALSCPAQIIVDEFSRTNVESIFAIGAGGLRYQVWGDLSQGQTNQRPSPLQLKIAGPAK